MSSYVQNLSILREENLTNILELAFTNTFIKTLFAIYEG